MKLLASLGAIIFSGVLSAAPLQNIVVFGDSLSDNGNLYEFMNHQLPPSPPYFEGRFSNGQVWIEHLATSYFKDKTSAHFFDYAFGGAGVSEEEGDDEVLFTLRREINNYLKEHQDKADPNSLFVLWIGSNNYLAMPEEMEKTVNTVNDGIKISIQRLVNKGAKHILVVNLPDLGSTPAAYEFDSVSTMTEFSKLHNQKLLENFVAFKQEYPEVEWLFFDMNSILSDVITPPQAYGFNNVTEGCSNSVANQTTKTSVLRMVAAVTPKAESNACDGYLFFDLVHPTAPAHKMLAEKARKMLDEAQVEIGE